MKQPKMNVDYILHDKLNEYPLLSTLNKSFILALIGKAASGKSHFLISLLKSKPLMNKVFENVIIFSNGLDFKTAPVNSINYI
jgi:GTPase SAR1 family protein